MKRIDEKKKLIAEEILVKIESQKISAQEGFELAYTHGILKDDVYNLFVNSKVLSKKIPEFLSGYIREVVKNANEIFEI